MAIILNGTDQGVNCGASHLLLVDAGSIFVYFEVQTTQATEGDYVCLGMGNGTRAVEIVGLASGVTFQAMSISGSIISPQITGNIKNGAVRRVFSGWSQQSDRRFAYVDGVQVSESVFGGFPDPDNLALGITTLGYRPWTGDGRFLAGQLANVAIWTGNTFGDLATENACAIDVTTSAGHPADYAPDCFWPLDYDARDAGVNGLHGTLVGSPNFTEEPPDPTSGSRWQRGDGMALQPMLKKLSGLVELE
jgi:hypothetical protein